jgi:hypothetical protein
MPAAPAVIKTRCGMVAPSPVRRFSMDCRVKPGNDDFQQGPRGSAG